MSADRMIVKAKIKAWPVANGHELERKVYVWCNYLARTTNKSAVIKEMTQLGYSNNGTAKDLMIEWCDSHHLSKSMEETLGYFLSEEDPSYINLDRLVDSDTLREAKAWADDAVKRWLDDMIPPDFNW